MKQNNPRIVVSDHALVKYIERIKGINLDNLREEILNPAIQEVAKDLGYTGKFPREDCTIVMRNKVIVTVFKNDFKMNFKNIHKTKKRGKYAQKAFKWKASSTRSTRTDSDGDGEY